MRAVKRSRAHVRASSVFYIGTSGSIFLANVSAHLKNNLRTVCTHIAADRTLERSTITEDGG